MTNSERIRSTALSWAGVTEHSHRFGGTEFRLGKRELGHVHGDRLVDIPFPKKVRDEVINAGLAERHHILPDSGWVSIWLRTPENLEQAITLLERSLELARVQAEKRALYSVNDFGVAQSSA
jgi:Family of unknown function (DUF5519)